VELTAYGWTIWLTGAPASGKTTLARALQRLLHAQGISSAVLDSDALRLVLTPHPTYSGAERDWFYAQLVEIAAWLTRAGENVIIAATGHRRRYRDAARARLRPFAEVWLRCPADICHSRDPKHLYAAVAAGVISGLPGVDIAYEPPSAPEVVVDTDERTPEEAAALVVAQLPFLQETTEHSKVHR
jgi:adenylylsulfate kinase